MDTTKTEKFEVALTVWLANAQEVIEDNHKNLNFPCASLETMYGRRYVRVVRVDGFGSGQSAHCFIDKTNGDVLKASGWKSPAKNFARGNIFTDRLGVGEFGAHYCYR